MRLLFLILLWCISFINTVGGHPSRNYCISTANPVCLEKAQMTLIRLPGLTNPVKISDPIYPGSHFTWGEATKNGTRIPVNTTIDGEVISGSQIVKNIFELAKELDRIRDLLGDRPIYVTSWYRDPENNRAVGGAKRSQHLRGWAADITVQDLSPAQAQARLKGVWSGGLGLSNSFTHLDLRDRLGLDSATWTY